jgi:hypothetical protein
MYYVKRGETVNGPYDESTVQTLFDGQKLKPNDLVSERPDGPWLLLAQSGIVASLLAPAAGRKVAYAGQAARQVRLQEKRRAAAAVDPGKTRRDVLYILGSIAGVFVFLAIVLMFVGFMWFWAPKTKTVRLEVGEATFTLKPGGWSHVSVVCDNGLVASAEWRPNSANQFGYEIGEPKVNRNVNQMSVMLLLRRVIANYLNGEYD